MPLYPFLGEGSPTNIDYRKNLRVDSPLFPTTVLFENRPFPWVYGGLLERRKVPLENKGTLILICLLEDLGGFP